MITDFGRGEDETLFRWDELFVGSRPKAEGRDDAILYDTDNGSLHLDNYGGAASGRTLLTILSDPQAEVYPGELRKVSINLNY